MRLLRAILPAGRPSSCGTPTGTWPDTNGYLGDLVNPNIGVTTIGARQYNPPTGRFLSVDPVLESTSPNQMGGYGYSADNPATLSDPSGLVPPPGAGGCPATTPGCPGYTDPY